MKRQHRGSGRHGNESVRRNVLLGIMVLGGAALGFGLTLGLLALARPRPAPPVVVPEPAAQVASVPAPRPEVAALATDRTANGVKDQLREEPKEPDGCSDCGAFQEAKDSMKCKSFPAIPGLRNIEPRIVVSRVSGVVPAAVYVSACATTMEHNGDPARFDPYQDLEFSWDFGDAAGQEKFDNPVARMPGQPAEANANVHQVGPEAAYVYREPDSYTIKLTARGRDERGEIHTAWTSVLIRKAEWMIVLNHKTGRPTAGTWTVTATVDGVSRTTAPLPWDVRGTEVIAALEAMPHIGAGNVHGLGGSYKHVYTMAGTGAANPYPLFLVFEGALLGKDVKLSVASNLDLGVYATARSPYATGGTAPQFTAVPFTGTTVYFDSNYAGENGASNGSFARPYISLSTSLVLASNTRNLLKRGSIFTLSATPRVVREPHNIYGPIDNLQIAAYGEGPKPRIVQSHGVLLSPCVNRDGHQTQITIADLEWNGYQSEWGDKAGGVLLTSTYNTGNPGGAIFGQTSHWLLDNVTILGSYVDRTAKNGVPIGISNGYHQWAFLWRCTIRETQWGGGSVFAYHPQGAAFVGCTVSGGRQDGIAHHIYNHVGDHSLVRWFKSERIGSDGVTGNHMFCFNMNAWTTSDQDGLGLTTRFTNIDTALIQGSANFGIDLSTTDNDSRQGAYDRVVVSNCHLHRLASSPFARLSAPITSYNSERVTVRDCWFTHMAVVADGACATPATLFQTLDPRAFWKFYRNRAYYPATVTPYQGQTKAWGEALAEIGGGTGGYFCYNVLKKASDWHSSNARPGVLITSFAGLANWEVHDNVYFLNHPDKHYRSLEGPAYYTLEQIQHDHDAERGSKICDPNFIDDSGTIDQPGNLNSEGQQEQPICWLGSLLLSVG